MPPPREEHAAAVNVERERGQQHDGASAPPRRGPSDKSRPADVVPQQTELEAELVRERTERAQEAALMGEMLVRVTEREAAEKAALARAASAEIRARELGVAIDDAHATIEKLQHEIDSLRDSVYEATRDAARARDDAGESQAKLKAAEKQDGDVEARVLSAEKRAGELSLRTLALEEKLADAEKRARSADEARARLATTEARATELAHELDAAQKMAEARVNELLARLDAEGRKATDAESRARNAEERARWCDEAVRASNATAEHGVKENAALKERLQVLEADARGVAETIAAKVRDHTAAMESLRAKSEGDEREVRELRHELARLSEESEQSAKLIAEAQETAALVTQELTETEEKLEKDERTIAAQRSELVAAHAEAERLRHDLEADHATVVTLEQKLAQEKKASEKLRADRDAEVSALKTDHARAAQDKDANHERAVAALQLQLTGAKNALKDAERRYEEARSKGEEARSSLASSEMKLKALQDASAKAQTVLEELTRREQMVTTLRARTLQQARDMLRGEATMGGGIATPSAMPVGKPAKARSKGSMAPIAKHEAGWDESWEDVISVEEGDIVHESEYPRKV